MHGGKNHKDNTFFDLLGLMSQSIPISALNLLWAAPFFHSLLIFIGQFEEKRENA